MTTFSGSRPLHICVPMSCLVDVGFLLYVYVPVPYLVDVVSWVCLVPPQLVSDVGACVLLDIVSQFCTFLSVSSVSRWICGSCSGLVACQSVFRIRRGSLAWCRDSCEFLLVRGRTSCVT